MLNNKCIMAGMMSISSSLLINAMENNNWQLIQNWQQAASFAGKVVACATTIDYFNTDYIYGLAHSGRSYGYVEKEPSEWQGYGKGYSLCLLLKKSNGFGRGHKILTNDHFKKGSFCMRSVTQQEAEEIAKAITDDKAKFDYIWDEKEKNIVAELQQISQLKLVAQ